MNRKHTSEPWHVGFDTPGVTCGVAERNPGYTLIVAACPPFAFGAAVGVCEREADAARIVACVNACAGMDDPAAEIAALRGMVKALSALVDYWVSLRELEEAEPQE